MPGAWPFLHASFEFEGRTRHLWLIHPSLPFAEEYPRARHAGRADQADGGLANRRRRLELHRGLAPLRRLPPRCRPARQPPRVREAAELADRLALPDRTRPRVRLRRPGRPRSPAGPKDRVGSLPPGPRPRPGLGCQRRDELGEIGRGAGGSGTGESANLARSAWRSRSISSAARLGPSASASSGASDISSVVLARHERRTASPGLGESPLRR